MIIEFTFLIWTSLIVFLSGGCNAIVDDVVAYNYIKRILGWKDRFWDGESWKDKKFLGLFVINAQHIFKFISYILILILFIFGLNYNFHLDKFQEICLIIWYICIFSLGFNIFYK